MSTDKKTPPVDEGGIKGAAERCSAAVHRFTEMFFEKQATVVVKHPGLTIAAVVVFTAVMAQGIWVYDEEMSPDKQFSPRDSQAVEDEDWVVERFGYEKRGVTMFFEANEGENMVTKDSLLFMMSMHEWLLAQWRIEDGVNVTYDVVCARYTANDDCMRPVSPLSFWDHNRTLLEADPNPLQTMTTVPWRTLEPSGPPFAYYFGDATYTASGEITYARATRMEYNLKNEKKELSGIGNDDPQSRYWEIQVAEDAERRRAADVATSGVGVFIKTEGQEEEAGDSAIEADIANLIIGYVIMAVYASFILSRSRPKYSHSMLGFVSVVSVGMSTFSAYGLCWFIGVKFNTVVQVLILVLLGVGVDDTFVIMDSWWDCAHISDMQDRMIAAVRHAGPAITITSVTDLIAFLAGSSTELPALKDFCYYAAVGIAFDFIFQVTFVVAVAYLDSVRQEKSRADVLCCLTVEHDTGICLGNEETRKNWTESQRGIQDKVVGTFLPRLILGSLAGKLVIIVASLAFLAVGIWGCTEVKMNYNNEWFIPEGHAFRDIMRVRDTYFSGSELPANAYFGAIDYPNEQATVVLGKDLLLGDRWVVANSTSSWLSDMYLWVQGDAAHNVHWDGAKNEIVPGEFYRLLKLYASTATGPQSAWQHIDNIRWNEAGDALVASRVGFRIIGKALSDGEAAVDAMDALRGTLRGVAFPWAFPFVFWESYKLIIPEITRNVAIAGSCVFVLVTIMIANIRLGLLVTLAIGCVDVCMLGFMPIVGVELNGVSVICIVLAVGLSVDYSVHIAGAFLRVGCDDGEVYSGKTQRAAYALWKMGPAVVNGGTSTFLAILPAAFAVSYVFRVFFRMFALIIFFGQWFGVLLLPVILSLAGPDAYLDADRLEDTPEANPLSTTESSPPQPPSPQSNEPDSVV